MTALDVFLPPWCISDPMVYFQLHNRLGDPQSRGVQYAWPEIPKPVKPYHTRGQGRCKLSDHTKAAYTAVLRCLTLCENQNVFHLVCMYANPFGLQVLFGFAKQG